MHIEVDDLTRAEVLGLLRTVLFAPEDLALVKGDPSERRRFLDDLLVLRTPRLAGVRADYDRVLRQRNTLLKSATPMKTDSAQSQPCAMPKAYPASAGNTIPTVPTASPTGPTFMISLRLVSSPT